MVLDLLIVLVLSMLAGAGGGAIVAAAMTRAKAPQQQFPAQAGPQYPPQGPYYQ
ncbi:hypothetical protein ABT324_23350 [Saccharopolyspora sp. NPDC000359]|uniref:hypothetical protein n=1 Tax=Saccharopolyspora sp. NPDC000359 TaxID=3154251 RepID=UPI00331BCE73